MAHTPGPWYTTSKADDRQGLIYSEETGANVAVSYDPKDAPIIAAAPVMLEALHQISMAALIPENPLAEILRIVQIARNAIYEVKP